MVRPPLRTVVRRVSVPGLAIALVGFVLTRFTVTFAVDGDPVQFIVVGVVPLSLGLALSAFGVALAVGSFEPAYVRTTAVWTAIGTGTMLVLAILTVVGADFGDIARMGRINPRTYLSNFLIGGAIGGAMTGLYAAENRKQRHALRQQADRLAVLNRSLRDRVLNAVLAIDGQIAVLDDRDDPELRQRVHDTVRDQADTIQQTVEDVKYLARSRTDARNELGAVDPATVVEAAVESVDAMYPSVSFEVDTQSRDSLSVWGDVMLERALEHLLVRAAESGADRVTVSITASDRRVRLRVVDDGDGLPAAHRSILSGSASADYDDPSVGFGLNVVRLVADTLEGRLSTTTDGETTVTFAAPRADADIRPWISDATDVRAYGVSAADIGIAVATSLLAGIAMGVVGQVTTGVVPIIGALYGSSNAIVGWVTHEFHSIVFGLTYAGVLASIPDSYAEDWGWCLATGLGWGFVLWLVAAGFVMPIWLGLVGVPAAVPSLSVSSLLGHLVWGGVLSLLYLVGQRVAESYLVSSRSGRPRQ
ncbi:MAG: ATP-binding protein [Halorhabdus sp.]